MTWSFACGEASLCEAVRS